MYRKALDYYGNVLTEKHRSVLMGYPLRRIMQLSLEESSQSESVMNDNTDGQSSLSSDDEPPAKKVTKTTRKILDDDKEAIRLQRQADREKCYAVARKHLQEGDFDGYFPFH